MLSLKAQLKTPRIWLMESEEKAQKHQVHASRLVFQVTHNSDDRCCVNTEQEARLLFRS